MGCGSVSWDHWITMGGGERIPDTYGTMIDMAQQLVPSTHTVRTTICNSSSRGSDAIFRPPRASGIHMVYRQSAGETYTQTHGRLVKDHRCRPGWWSTPLVPPLGRQRQVDFCEFEVCLICIFGSRPVGLHSGTLPQADIIRGTGTSTTSQVLESARATHP